MSLKASITYWLFQYNPNHLDLKMELKTKDLKHFPLKAHKDKIKVGDKVILWQSGKGAACYGLGVVKSLPENAILESGDASKSIKWPFVVELDIEHNLWKSPFETSFLPKHHRDKKIFSGLPSTTVLATKEDYNLILDWIKQIELVEEPLLDYSLPVVPDYPLNLVLYGPPGTGKTYKTINYALATIEKTTLEELSVEKRTQLQKRFELLKQQGQIEQITFHASMSYEDFVEGIRPNVKQNTLSYEVEDGLFKRMCQKAALHQEQGKRYVLIIDELNRGNIANIFGELISLIEPDKRNGESEAMEVLLPYSKKRFSVPNNLYLICTMNTADRSTTIIDAALRRRFAFRKFSPSPSLLKRISQNSELKSIDLARMLSVINQRIKALLDEDHCIGHAYFLKVRSLDDLKHVFYESIIPQLETYFFKDYQKIGLILGRDFVQTTLERNGVVTFADFDYPFKNELIQEIQYQLRPPDEIDRTAFIHIYESMKSKPQ